MLPYTSAKLSIRLPPTLNPTQAKKFVTKTLTENPPYNAKVEAAGFAAGEGFNSPSFPTVLGEAVTEASNAYYGNKDLAQAEGGSIPFMGFLQGLWPEAKFIVTGVLGPNSNAHGPN